METANSGSGNKVFIWVGVGCLVFALCAVLAIVLGFVGLARLGTPPEDAVVKAQAPIELRINDEAVIEITVTNNRADSLEVISIDFSMNYLDGFLITETIPSHTKSQQFDSLGGGETFQSYYFYATIAPGQSMTFVFKGQALINGDFSGSVEACIDSDYACVGNILRTIVR